ncbi:phage portal protein [Mesorhizobium sp. M0983]|uniref:phage portal protein n=1 Tax=Mesorhizobium sp. M0983 TaxID=2957040 RepID=UPI003339BEE1
MNPIDALIAFVAPERGVRRILARDAIRSLAETRAYAAAGQGRRNKGWRARPTSSNAEIGASLNNLRNRSREYVRDSWAGQRILDVMVSHVVGTGIVPAVETGSDRANKKFSLAWEEWSAAADIEGVLDFGGQQSLGVRSMIEGGDTVLRYHDITMNEAGRTVPFRLQGLEGDQIDTSRDAQLADQNVRLGVKLGANGRRLGLYLHEDHPGEMTLKGTSYSSNLVAWNDLSHLYRPLRWGQVRGASWFAPILLTAKEIQDLTDAAIVKARVEACFAAFRKNAATGASPFAAKTDENGDKVTRIEPGMIFDIGDSDIVFAQPSSQSSFAEVYIAGMQAMAAGIGMTYDQLTGDLRQANYSSMRAGRIEFRRLVEQIQWHIVIPRLCIPVLNRFVARAVLSGILPDRREGYPVKWITPANEPIDPKKDLEADILAVRSGRLSPQEFISAWGRDWRAVVADYALFLKAIDDAGVPLDIDPRKPANGLAAPAPGDQTKGNQDG